MMQNFGPQVAPFCDLNLHPVLRSRAQRKDGGKRTFYATHGVQIQRKL
jgi:hypothetical protein